MSKSRGNVIDPNDVINGISLDKMVERLNHSVLSNSEKGKSMQKYIIEFLLIF